MWISVVPAKAPGCDMLLPMGLAFLPAKRPLPLRYGAHECHVIPGTATTESSGSGDSIDHPATVLLSPGLASKLHLRPEPVYQLRVHFDRLEIGPVVGLLLGSRNHWYDDAYLNREPHRVLGVYPQTGGLICAFSPRNLSEIDGCAYGMFYDPGCGKWRYGALPVPSVMHRRSFHDEPSDIDRLRRRYGVRIFNSHRYDKLETFLIMRLDPALRPHLPETARLTSPDVATDMIRRHGGAVLKPVGLSRGRGIVFTEAVREAFRVSDYRHTGLLREQTLAERELYALVTDLTGETYLCQQRLDLAVIDGAPFDIRVVMQRNRLGDWQCTGIECRLAARGQSLTNIAAGGRALFLPEAVSHAFAGRLDGEAVRSDVLRLADRLCQVMDDTGEDFAEFGIDMALDRDGRLWFIEVNVLPTFKGFQKIDQATYHALLANPLQYAVWLAGFGRDNSETGPDSPRRADHGERVLNR